ATGGVTKPPTALSAGKQLINTKTESRESVIIYATLSYFLDMRKWAFYNNAKLQKKFMIIKFIT
ncbi:MAG: hypothetical protein IKA81_05185, partial [Alistipes sp.]|nr:hypothetical protein [Alistipes sp.]